MKRFILFGLLAIFSLSATAQDESFKGIGFVDMSLSQGSYTRYGNAASSTFTVNDYFKAKTYMLNFNIGGSLLGLAIKDRRRDWFVGDASFVSVNMGGGATVRTNENQTKTTKEGGPALGTTLGTGVMGLYTLSNGIVIGSRFQWVLQSEFIPFTGLDHGTGSHKKLWALQGCYKGWTGEIQLYTPWRLMYDKTIQTRHNNRGFGLDIKKRIGEKYYFQINYSHTAIRYKNAETFNSSTQFDFENWWKPTFNKLSIGFGMGF